MSLERIEQGLRQVLSAGEAEGASCPAKDLYRYAAGEATPEEAAAFEQHLAQCASCRADLETFRGLTREEAPPAKVVRLRAWLTARTLAPLAVAAVGLIAVGLWQAQRAHLGDPLQIKGGYKLHVAVQRGEQRFTGVSGSVFELGDTLGLFYTAPADAYLTALVADEAGSIAQAYPSGAPVKLSRGVEQRLPAGAVVEKGTPCEWIVAFFSPEPIAAQTLRAELARAVSRRAPDCTLPPLRLPAAVDVFLLRRASK